MEIQATATMINAREDRGRIENNGWTRHASSEKSAVSVEDGASFRCDFDGFLVLVEDCVSVFIGVYYLELNETQNKNSQP